MTRRSATSLSFDRVRRTRLGQYAVALIATGVALYFRRVMTPLWNDSLTFISFFPAIAFSAWFGGFAPGAVCTLLSAAVAYIWLPSRFSNGSTLGDVLAFAFFFGTGLFVSVLTRDVREAQLRAERTAEELRNSEQERERMLLLEQLARADAERANQAKDKFLSIVSHELKQPLSAMVAALPVLRLRLSPEALVRAEHTIDVFQRQVQYLSRLVDDLLDASHVVDGRVSLERRSLDARDILRDAVDVVRPRADQREQQLAVNLPNTALVVDADAVRLQGTSEQMPQRRIR